MNKLNRIIKDGVVYVIEDGECNPKCAFYHDAKGLAQQAAEGIREYLKSFHEKKSK